ncbi:MAG TPA: SDR family oxidoreductase [Methyloceanibacter sp.]|nr:SDR family oxidoreductase [Methyloceanibacter sp.]
MDSINKRAEHLAPAVVITGATQGIGRALAEEFAREGHALLLVARDDPKLAAAARSLAKAHGVEVKFAACDLSTLEGCAEVEEALKRFGLYADILVNNAAMMTAGFFQEQDKAKLRRLIDLNVQAVVDLTRRFLPGMIARRRGGVLNVASIEGFMPVPYQAPYAATKAFVLSFSRALSYETMGTGVRVSALAPGTTATGLHAKAGAENSRYAMLLPAMTSEHLARVAYRKFKRGRKVIVVGWFNRLSVLAQHFTPQLLLVPMMGWLFRVRDEEGNLQMPRAPGTPKAGNGLPADAASSDGPSLPV